MLRLTVWVACFFSVVVADDWPTWQHDNRRTGSSSERVEVDSLVPQWTWRSAVPPVTAWHGPAKWDAYAYHRNLPSMRSYDNALHVIAVGDRVWFGSSVDDSLYCLDANTGDVRWSFTADAPIRLAPTWDSDRVFFGSDDGYARCLDAQTGELIWRSTPTGSQRHIWNNGRLISPQPCRTGVVVADGKAWYANAMLPWQTAWLSCVDAATGTADSDEHFVQELPGRTMEGPPALSREYLVLPQGRVAPRLFDRDTGEDAGEMVKSGGGSVVVVSLDEDILHGPATDSRKGGFRRSSGESREVIAGLGRGNALVVDGTLSWMLTDTELVCSSLTTGQIQWKVKTDCPCSLVRAGDTMFAGGIDQIRAYSAADGSELWTAPAEGRVFSMAVARGRVFASTDLGAVHCFAAGRPEQVQALAESTKRQPRSTEPAKVLTAPDDQRLIGHWAFQQASTRNRTINSARGPNATTATAPVYSRTGDYESLELDGRQQSVMVAAEFQAAPLPQQNFSCAAWVRVDQPQEWGGIVGVIQDDGAVERGWLLGYRKDRFSIALATEDGPQRLTYVISPQPFESGQWSHVAATYDGQVVQLFVNGQLAGSSKLPSGPIRYPERAWYEIGAYHDSDEYFRMRGGIQEISVYQDALAAGEITALYDSGRRRFPAASPVAEPVAGPLLTFDSPDSAIIRWTTRLAQPSLVELAGPDGTQRFESNSPTKDHRVTVSGLKHNRIYHYRVALSQKGGSVWSKPRECDTFFNFTQPAVPDAWHELADQTLVSDPELLPDGPGLGLLAGQFTAEQIAGLVAGSQLRLVVVSNDDRQTRRLREQLKTLQMYGHRVTVQTVQTGDPLPFVGAWASVVIAQAAPDGANAELRRMMRPAGGVLLSVDRSTGRLVKRDCRDSLPGAADWTHLYGSADNSAFAGEKLGGATRSDQLNVQWVGRPGPRYQSDRSGRKPSPLVAGGRMFLQGLDRIVAVDVFNGTILWSQELTGFGRFNVPRDCSNWCATDEAVYLIVEGECWKFSADQGELISRFAAADAAAPGTAWGYVSVVDGALYGTQLPAGTSWDDFWGDANAGWYDARSGEVTYPVCSDRVFRRDANTGELAWEYQRGVVLNATITVAGDTMYFVESRSESVLQSDIRRVGDPKLWEDLHLVAIDAQTGSPRWEQRLDVTGPQVVCHLAHAQNQLTLVTSAEAEFQVRSFSEADGAHRWTSRAPWAGGKGDHGKAMMRPAISGDRIYLRPHVLSLTDGRVRKEKMPDGHGCGTYACTADSVLYRAKTVTMWSPDNQQTSTWDRLRPDCWLSTIPACGMLLSPEGGGGCSCGSWMETSIGFLPAAFDP
ncbi:MAG: PQQ-binding-like beta-propeller repeat protein [Planctomycetaceae bacterium]|nr:PQQ-binding-like beta-propeller repeat protein [Planctomycetaceae bacterium]